MAENKKVRLLSSRLSNARIEQQDNECVCIHLRIIIEKLSDASNVNGRASEDFRIPKLRENLRNI